MAEISVIIPVYNVEKYLRECLDSVLAQTFTDWEAICVNDDSPDGCPAILEEYAAKDDRFKIISQENGGQGKARNEGIKRAKGKYIYLMDSDDWLEPDTLKLCYETAEKHDLDMVMFQIIPELEPGMSKEYMIDNKLFSADICGIILPGTEIFKKLFLNNCGWRPSIWRRFYSERIFDQTQLRFNEKIEFEDLHFSIQMDFLISRAMCIKDCLYHYRIRPNSVMTRKPRIKDFYSRHAMYECMNSIFQKNFHKRDELLNQALLQRVYGNIAMATTIVEQLEKDELAKYVADHPETNDFFVAVSLEINKQKEYREKLDAAFAENDSLKEKLDFVLNKSLSYRIGKMITWLPQKIKGLFKHE